MTPRMPVRRMTSNARDGVRAFIVLTHSSRTRSSATLRNVSSVGSMAASVAGSSSISSVATKRAARRTRRPSSEKRSTGSPTARMTRAREVLTPVERVDELAVRRVHRDGVDGEVAAREIGGDVVDELNGSPGGGRPSRPTRRAGSSPRSGACSATTVTVPCSMPVGIARGKIARSSLGRASVQMSQSFASWRPSSRSRTQPPTIHARLPFARRRSQRANTSAGTRSSGTRSSVGPSPSAYHAAHGRRDRPQAGLVPSLPMLDFTDEEKLAASPPSAPGARSSSSRRSARWRAASSPSTRRCARWRPRSASLILRAPSSRRLASAPRRGGRERHRRGGAGHKPAMMAILMMELSRCCPGFAHVVRGIARALRRGGHGARDAGAERDVGAPRTDAGEDRRVGADRAWRGERCLRLDGDGGAEGRGGLGPEGGPRRSSRTRRSPTSSSSTRGSARRRNLLEIETSRAHPQEVRAFIVERSAAGVATSKPFAKMGMHASPTGEISLDDVFVPDSQLLGGNDAPNARSAAKASLSNERFGMTPMCLGMIERCLDESVKYAKERKQWGRAIADFQLVQEKIARMYTAKMIVKALLLRQLEAERLHAPLAAEEASATKLYCARITTDCALEAVQLMGGAGYMTGSVVEMMARDAKLFQIGGGTDDIRDPADRAGGFGVTRCRVVHRVLPHPADQSALRCARCPLTPRRVLPHPPGQRAQPRARYPLTPRRVLPNPADQSAQPRARYPLTPRRVLPHPADQRSQPRPRYPLTPHRVLPHPAQGAT